MSKRVINYAPGPAMLPDAVVESARDQILGDGTSGVGILEQSHRTPQIQDLFDETESLVRQIGKIPDDYEVLLLTGGASLPFAMVPLNLVGPGLVADYIDSGPWSQLAIDEARSVGSVNVIPCERSSIFRLPPGNIRHRLTPNSVYLHYTSNETTLGTQFAEPPAVSGVPLVCDACSDLFSRPLDIRRYGIIYASGQKNLGTSGVSLVLIQRELISRKVRELPKILRYGTHAAARSRYNTPPVFSVLVMNRMLKWIADQGGLGGMDQQNRKKSGLVYDFLDSSRLFRGMAPAHCRSIVSVTFTTGRKDFDQAFVNFAESRGLTNLQGHRSVGGLRASFYNGMPSSGALRLVETLRDFEQSGGPARSVAEG